MTYKACDLGQVTTSLHLSFLAHALWLVTAPASQGRSECEMRSCVGRAQLSECQRTADVR